MFFSSIAGREAPALVSFMLDSNVAPIVLEPKMPRVFVLCAYLMTQTRQTLILPSKLRVGSGRVAAQMNMIYGRFLVCYELTDLDFSPQGNL